MRTFVATGLATLVAIAAPMPAFAECPSPSDMEGGVTFVRSEPRMESHFVRNPDGTVLERRVTHRDDASVVTTESTHLLGLVAVTRTEDGRPSLVTNIPGDEIPATVPPAGNFALDGVIEIDGEPTLNIALEYEVPGDNGTVTIGSCEYETDVIRHVATITQIDGGENANRLFFEYRYARDLGVILETIHYQDESFTTPGAIVSYDTAAIGR